MAETLPAAARDIVEHVRLSYRAWAPAQQRPPSLAGRLAGGHSHLNLLLRGDGDCWVLRIPRQDRPDGVCYARELCLHALAAARSLAPAVVLAEPASGLLVTTYLAQDDGEAADDGKARSSAGTGPGGSGTAGRPGYGRGTPAAVAGLLRAIHALDLASLPAGECARIDLSPLDTARELARLRHGLGRRDPLRDLPHAADQRLRIAAGRDRGRPDPAVICHNDLLGANRLVHRGQLLAIDWEYARPGDPFFDLAVVASEFDAPQRAALWAAYLQRPPTGTEQRQLMDQLVLYSAIAACWYARHSDAPATRGAVDRLVTIARQALPGEDGPGP